MIIRNAIRTPDGTVLDSLHAHDYKEYVDANGHTYIVDGGRDYRRRGSSQGAPPPTELSLTEDDPYETIRMVPIWGTRGKDGDQPLKCVSLADMEDDHIEAVLLTQFLPSWLAWLMRTEKAYRWDTQDRCIYSLVHGRFLEAAKDAGKSGVPL